MKKIISLFLFFLLTISSLTIAGANSIGFNSIEQTQNNSIESTHKVKPAQDAQYDSKQYQINLSENISVGENGNSPIEKQNDAIEQTTNVQISLNLSEKVSASENNFDHNTIAILKQDSDRKTTMERIWNMERIRFNGKSIIQNNELFNDRLSIKNQINLIDDVKQFFDKSSVDDADDTSIQFLDEVLFAPSTDTKNTAVLLLLLPLVWHLIYSPYTRYHKNKITALKTHAYFIRDVKQFAFIFRSKKSFSRSIFVIIFFGTILGISTMGQAYALDCSGSAEAAGNDAVAETITCAPSETVSISDTVAKSTTKSLSEQLNAADTLANSLTKSLSEQLNAADTVANTVPYSRTLSEQLNAADTLANSLTKSLSEQLSASDTVTTLLSLSKSLSEQISASDTVSTTATLSRTLSETVTISDTSSFTNTLSRTLSEQLSASDTLSVGLDTAGSRSDTLSISDTVTKTVTYSRTLSEQLKVDDVRANNIAATQQLVSNIATAVTVDSAKPELVITSSSAALSTVTVPSTVTAPTINYATILVANAVTITNSLTIDTDSSIDVLVTMPAGITISGTSWTGVLNLPSVKSTTSVTPPSESGVTNTIRNVVEIGFDSVTLTFDKAVRLKLVGEAGKDVGYAPSGGTLTEITTTCSGDTQAINNGLAAGAECKIDVGSDLVVWTKHFTSFASFSSSSTPSSSSTSSAGGSGRTNVAVGSGGGGGGGGGGGMILFETGELKLYEISWDVCDSGEVNILASTDGDPRSVSAKIRTTSDGAVKAELASQQPFEKENSQTKTQRLLFIAPIDPKETFFAVAVEDGVSTKTKLVNIDGCTGTITVSKFEDSQIIKTTPVKSEKPQSVIPELVIPKTTEEEPSEISPPVKRIPESVILIIKEWLVSTDPSSDSKMLNAIGIDGNYIPPWFKKNAKWLYLESISQQEFLDSLTYMHENGLLIKPEIIEKVKEIQPETPIKTQEKAKVEEDENMRNIVIFATVIAIASLLISILITKRTKRVYVLAKSKTRKKDDEQLAITTKVSASKTEQIKTRGRLDLELAEIKITEMKEKFAQMSYNEVLERVNKNPVGSEYFVAVDTNSKKWQGVMEDTNKIVHIDGNGSALIPFRGKKLTDDLTIYNVIIQKLTKDDTMTVSIIKNGVPIDTSKTNLPYGKISLIGKCVK